MGNRQGAKRMTYSVPAMPVLMWDSSPPGTHLASPKSAILGTRFSSSRILLPFMSRWMILTGEPNPPWRYASPSATPRTMSIL
uniref:Uncharacterized protein n=1 Tax=Kalanchoe fedtschenkoi TaxID=63787 RepID=A0A7N0ZRZ0_KALFE